MKRTNAQRFGIALIVAGALTAFGACVVSFDPSGQPCDSKGGCAKGYACSPAKTCLPVKASTTGVFGSVASGSTGSKGSTGSVGSTGLSTGSTGPASNSTGLSTTTGSRGSTGSTGASPCASHPCPTSEACELTSGSPTCVKPAVSITCASNADCTNLNPNYVCLLPTDSTTPSGFCSAECAPGETDGGCAPSDSCVEVANAYGAAVGLCLPSAHPTWCASNTLCNSVSPPLDCIYFGEPGDGSLPVSFCDTPGTGKGIGHGPCSQNSDCAEGNCVDAVCLGSCAGVPGVDAGLCPTGLSCRLFDLGNLGAACSPPSNTSSGSGSGSGSGSATGSGAGTTGGSPTCGPNTISVCSP